MLCPVGLRLPEAIKHRPALGREFNDRGALTSTSVGMTDEYEMV
jgi:hypothetical protein